MGVSGTPGKKPFWLRLVCWGCFRAGCCLWKESLDISVISLGPDDHFCIMRVEATYFSLLSLGQALLILSPSPVLCPVK